MANQISRRNLIKGIGVGAFGLGIGTSLTGSARAQTAPSSAAVPAYYRFTLGEAEIAVIKDASVTIAPTIFGANVEESALDDALAAVNVPRNEDGTINNLFDIMMVRIGDRNVLMDTGLPLPNAALVPALEAMGLTPADITDVVITHFHPDHVGKVSIDGEIVFPQAQYYMPQVEYDFITADGAPDAVAGAVEKIMPVVDNDQMAFYTDEQEIIPGIMAVATPGHTLGHHGLMIASGGKQLFNMVDLALNAFLSVPNPTWQAGFDLDGALAVETRQAALGRAADEGFMVFGYHFPFPGVGFISRDGEGFRFTPAGF